VGNYDEVEQAL